MFTKIFFNSLHRPLSQFDHTILYHAPAESAVFIVVGTCKAYALRGSVQILEQAGALNVQKKTVNVVPQPSDFQSMPFKDSFAVDLSAGVLTPFTCVG